MRPDDIVQRHYEGHCRKRHQHGEQRAEGWQEGCQDNAADQEQDHLSPEHVRRLLLDRLVQHSTNKVRVHLHPRVNAVDRRGAQIKQAWGGGTNKRYAPLE